MNEIDPRALDKVLQDNDDPTTLEQEIREAFDVPQIPRDLHMRKAVARNTALPTVAGKQCTILSQWPDPHDDVRAVITSSGSPDGVWNGWVSLNDLDLLDESEDA